MNIVWLANRLRAMSPAELVHRIWERFKKSHAKGRYEGWQLYENGGALPTLPQLRSRLACASPELRAAIQDSSRRILAGEFSALGVQWPLRSPANLFPEGIWQLDPVTGKLWPGADTYCFDISYRHQKSIGDVKYVWELSRLQFLQPLAADVFLNENQVALDAIETAIKRWAEANPPFRGVHWAEILNVAIRAISLLVVASFCGSHLSAETTERLRAMLSAHAFWLSRFPSAFSSANNHLIAEVAAEYLIAVAMPTRTSKHVEQKAWETLCKEIEKQFLPDGMNAEQSPTYGAFSAEFALFSAIVARDTGKAIPNAVEERLWRFADHIFTLADSTGRVPSIGDNDEGRVLTLSQYEDRYPASVAMAISAVLDRQLHGVVHPYASLRDVLWTTAPKSLPAKFGCITFDSGGMSVVREAIAGRSAILTFDHGPVGYLSIAAHGHADALSITLSLDDRPVLVDPGTYLYHSGGAWRDWFRGTRAHNALSVGGVDQSRISGPFNWSSKANSVLTERLDGESWRLSATHDGYLKSLGVIHERKLERLGNTLSVTDRLRGDARSLETEISFQFSSEILLHIRDGEVLVQRDQQTIMIIRFSSKGIVNVRSGGDACDGGWVSEKFGQKSGAARLSWKGVLPDEGLCSHLEIVGAQMVQEKVMF